MVDFQFCFIGNSLHRSTNNRYGYCFADDNKFCDDYTDIYHPP